MFYLAWRNITRRLGSSVLTAFIAFMAVLALTASMIVATSLEDGVRLSRERLGADIMVLPAGASGNASEVLFCAEPVNVYLPASAAEAVAATEGVAASTPQFFTQTVDQSCCSVVGVTRVVGIDATTDFVLAPWIVGGVEGAGGAGASAEVDDFGLGDDGILLGSAAPTIEGGQASILGSVFHVAGTLAPTGTSVDETIFMDIDAARTIAAASPYLKSVWGDADPFDAVSCLMVKAADGSDIDALCQALVDAVPGSVAVRTADMVSGASSQLAVVEAIAMAFLVVLVVLAALALAGRFLGPGGQPHARARAFCAPSAWGAAGSWGASPARSGWSRWWRLWSRWWSPAWWPARWSAPSIANSTCPGRRCLRVPMGQLWPWGCCLPWR